MGEQPIPSFYNDLDETRVQAFGLLSRGVKDRRSAMHAFTVATVDAAGRPRLRTVVNRGFDVETRTLRFHTDTRSDKLAELARNPAAAVHIYDARAKIQLRMQVDARMHHIGELRQDAWQRTRPFSRECYRVVDAPGSAISEPEQVPFLSDEDPESGVENFAVVTLQINMMEWLYLAHSGHRRARFIWNESKELKQTWLVP